MFRKMSAGEEVAPGEKFVTVTQGMSGYFAVIMWVNDEEPQLGPFTEPYDTGMGRYATIGEAEAEALAIAQEENLPYFF